MHTKICTFGTYMGFLMLFFVWHGIPAIHVNDMFTVQAYEYNKPDSESSFHRL